MRWKKFQYRITRSIIAVICLLFTSLVGCSPSTEYQEVIDYEPVLGDDWEISTPEAEGIDPELMAEMYYKASKMDTIYSLLVVKNGKITGEKYFNAGSIDQLSKRASVTKSYVSALVGIALDRGYLTSPDQKMLDFFPDIVDQVTDPRKKQITIRNMLEMKAGYPWEEEDAAAWAALWSGEYLSHIAGIPLFTDPGTRFKYSNLTSHWLGIIVARASGMDLMSFGTQYLFSPLGVEPGEDWNRDLDGYYIGCGDILFTARDMAKFGLLYLNEGRYEGNQLIPESWVKDSLETYSEKAWSNIGHFHEIGYGYQWWSAKAGDYRVNFAWGHGGQLIVLVDELDLVIVTTADSFYGEDAHFNSWKYEKAIIEMAADFVHSISDDT